MCLVITGQTVNGKGKDVPLQARTGSEGSRKLRFPDFVTKAQDGDRMSTLPPFWVLVMKSGDLNFLQPSGPLQACNGTALPLPLQ